MESVRYALLALVAFSCFTHATYFDSSTGLYWLDLRETRGQSYNEVLLRLTLGDLAGRGWHFATGDQFDTMVTNMGGTPMECAVTSYGADFDYCGLTGTIGLVAHIQETLGDISNEDGVHLGVLDDVVHVYPDGSEERASARMGYSFPTGEEYIFTHGDYDSNDTTYDEQGSYLITEVAPKAVIEAESMALSGGYAVEDNAAASGGQLIRRLDSGGYAATASTQFAGPAGSYDIAVSYFDEYDGMSSLAFLLNGEMLDQWIADEDPACRECASPNETTLRSRVVARNVRLSTGDEITLQGTGEHYEYARFDKITVAPVSSNILEAEKMTLEGGYAVEDNAAASGGQLIRRLDSGGYAATASTQFAGPAGSYDIAVSYFDEYDGMSSLAFLLNGEMLDQWVADEDPACRECASPNERTLRSRVVARDVRLSSGDEITLQGTGEHYEYARFDKITFHALEPLPQSPVVFDDGGVHNIDYTISAEEVQLRNGTTLNILAGAKLQRLVTYASDFPSPTFVLNVYDGRIDGIVGYGPWDSSSETFNIYGGTVGSIDIEGGTVEIGGGNIGSLTTWVPSLTISGGVFGDLHAKGKGSQLTISGGTFLEKVNINSDYLDHKVAISGGLFNGGFDILNYGSFFLVFYGELELVLLNQRVEDDDSFAEYSIEGTLRDGAPLSTTIFCRSWDWSEEEPCPWVSITVEP